VAKTNRKEIEKWVKTWKQASSKLEVIKENELRAPDYYTRNMDFLNAMLEFAFEHREILLSSGLIEQQRIFMKLQRVS